MAPNWLRLMTRSGWAFAVVREVRAPVFSFTFGMPTADQIAALKARDILIIGTATKVAEARSAYAGAIGVDVITAQGSEAGGHRGTFSEHSMVGTMALVPQVVSAVKLPVIAAGGIGDGRGVAAAFCLSASAVALGTSFLLTDEGSLEELPTNSPHIDLSNIHCGRFHPLVEQKVSYAACL
jgi:nitronate monooxygenase